jgi:hypothetical protein
MTNEELKSDWADEKVWEILFVHVGVMPTTTENALREKFAAALRETDFKARAEGYRTGVNQISDALKAEREVGKLLGKAEEWEQIAATAKDEKKDWLLRKAAKYRDAARKSEPPQQEPGK